MLACCIGTDSVGVPENSEATSYLTNGALSSGDNTVGVEEGGVV